MGWWRGVACGANHEFVRALAAACPETLSTRRGALLGRAMGPRSAGLRTVQNGCRMGAGWVQGAGCRVQVRSGR
eukprot:COSAG06_NODE_62020_length_266_cov_0.616766_1_plen_73_part_01